MISIASFYCAMRDTFASITNKCPGKTCLGSVVNAVVSPIFTACSDFMKRCVGIGTRVVKWFNPDPLKIGYLDDREYKPRIVVTGEKTDSRVMEVLKKYTQQEHAWIALEELHAKSSSNTLGYDRDKDLLLLVIHKSPGSNPIRGFSEFDGPLNSYTKPICDFTRRGALVIVDPREGHSIEDIQKLADLQLPEAKAKALHAIKSWETAKAVQDLFRTSSV